MFGRRREEPEYGVANGHPHDVSGSDRGYSNDYAMNEKSQLRRATRPRMFWGLITSLLLLVSVVFLILVEVGDTSTDSIRSKIWFVNLDVSNIVPTSVPDAVLINSIAQSLGLHDFYTVGLWGYCEGYNGQGVTNCSTPQALFWFNPVAILKSQLLAGATIALPAEVTDILNIVHIVSNWMFGLFLTGVCLNFVLIFLVPLGIYSRWATLPLSILTFLGALFVTVAAAIATAVAVILQAALTAQDRLNIKASIGIEMMIFIWIAAAFSILAWLVQLGMCCCCASRRDVRTGRKRGSRHAYDYEPTRRSGHRVADEE